MIKTITVETRHRTWRGDERVTVEDYTQIEGVVVSTTAADQSVLSLGRTPVHTIQAGDETVTVAHVGGLAQDMRPVRSGDHIRVLATDECVVADYTATTVERI